MIKGILLTPIGELSEEAKKKLDKMLKARDERMKKILEDYRNGKL